MGQNYYFFWKLKISINMRLSGFSNPGIEGYGFGDR